MFLTKKLTNGYNGKITKSGEKSSVSENEFQKWRNNLVTDPNILGGETVFPNSRLSVSHIGRLLERGELKEIILEDYPYLCQTDLEFASIYVKNKLYGGNK